MPQTIFAISPVNKIKVPVGNIDIRYRIATFYISEARFFKEAENTAGAVGIDRNIFARKAIQFCDFIQFDLWDGRKYKITREDFEKNCWLYPPSSKQGIKAPRSSFVPKLMVSLEKLKELDRENHTREEEEMIKQATM